MKRLSAKILLCLAVLCGSLFAGGQTNIGGTINTYVDVTIIGPCANKITVSNSSGFTAGNSVILIQMQGATMDESNTSSFGNVISPGNSGYWEKAVIHSVVGNVITFTKNLLNSYSITGKVQMIRMPTYANAIVNATLTGSAWNGTTGGVLAIEVTGTLTLNTDIDMSGLGFRGAPNTQTCPANCFSFISNSAYYYGAPNFRGAYKGEGITAAIAGKELGRGKQSNGGGGGNDHNTGGGGGGNYSNGGLGGDNYDTPANSCYGHGNNGIGGLSLDYSENSRLFLGGGGGAGHGNNGSTGGCPNNGVTGPGGKGGGIIILIANSIDGNGFGIIASGLDGGNSVGDGAGGGGAGGAIFIYTSNFIDNLNIDVSGGDGGDSHNGTDNYCYGPGGGGGAGIILTTSAFPGNVSTNTNGGLAGIVTNSTNACNGSSTTATDGNNTPSILTGLSIRQGSVNPSSGCGLPVTFIHFTAKAIKEIIELKWATATEVDADYFAIERSSNNIDFTEVGRVTAAGNTSTRTDYQFLDSLPYRGINYYRIRQADVTGYEKLTQVISVSPEIHLLVKNIYPNPLGKSSELKISFTDPEIDHHIGLYDISGRKIMAWYRRRQAATIFSYPLPSIHPGIYLLIVETAERRELHKIAVE
jgi:hypothetical protein